MTTSILDWLTLFGNGNAPSNTTLGEIEISFSTSTAAGGAPATQSSLVSDQELGAETGGHLRLAMDADVTGQGFVQSIELRNTDFPPAGVREVSFELLGLDENFASDLVQIQAFDFFGNALPADAISLTTTGTVAVAGDTADGETSVAADSTDGNVSVTVSGGEISRIDIIYTSGPEDFGNPAAQSIGIGPVSITSPTIFDDSDGVDDGTVTGTVGDDVIYGGTEADGGRIGSAGASGADNDSTFPDDFITAGGGDDRIYGGAGADTISGGSGEDTIFGGDGANTLNGGADADDIFGGSEGETISGGGGNDLIVGGGGADIINGNSGIDRISLGASEATSVAAIDGGSENDTLQITFTSTDPVADLRLVSIQALETIAFSGNDVDATVQVLDTQASGLSGLLFDTFNSNTEIFSVTMDAETTLDLSSLGISNANAEDFVRIEGDSDGETITGTFGGDLISGHGGADELSGGQGDDTLFGGAGSDTLFGGANEDILDGGENTDTIDGGASDDTVVASGGDDTIDGGTGTDVYDGSALDQLVVIVDADGDGVAGKTDTGAVESEDDLTSVEHFIAGETPGEPDILFYDSEILNTDVPTAISGLTDAAAGTFTPAGTTVAINFGPSETYQLSNILSGTSPGGLAPGIGPVGDYIIESGDEDGQLGGISFANFEVITFTVGTDGIVDGLDTGQVMELSFTDADGDQITTGDDSIRGNDGNDTIDGGAGSDTIDAGANNDLVEAGLGNDTIDGGEGIDTIAFSDATDGVTISFEFNSALSTATGIDVISGFENIIGSDFRDVINGDANDNTINGGAGDDFISGFGGADLLLGGEGSDRFRVFGDDPSFNSTLNGGSEDDFIELFDATLHSLRDAEIIDVEQLFFGLTARDQDVTVELTAEQLAGFEEVFTFTTRTTGGQELDVEMGDATALDLSAITFTNFILDGDGLTVTGDDNSETFTLGDGISTTINAGGGNDVMIAGGSTDALFGGDDDDTFEAENREAFFGDTVDGGNGGTDEDVLDLSGLGRFRVVNETDDADGDSTSGTVEFLDAAGAVEGSLTFSEIEQIICFTTGTSVMTRRGQVPVEQICAGDYVLTRDNGFQEICWSGRRDLSADELCRSPKLHPIVIRKGALGPDLPTHDMWVSPNHRMLEQSAAAQMHLGEREVLVAAKHMTQRVGISHQCPGPISYIHIMCERHEVILADGCWTESFCPGDEAVASVSPCQREELFELFPDLRTGAGRDDYRLARRSLRSFEAQALAGAPH